MSPEFVDVTVRMKPEQEAAFRQAISRLPQYAVIGTVATKAQEKMSIGEMSWEEELIDLRVTVMEVKESLARQDRTALRGFRKLNDYASAIPSEKFTEKVVGLLERSVSAYEMFKERPGVEMPRRVFKYKEIGGALTPRYVRLAVRLFALDGKEVERDVVFGWEGTSQSNPNEYINNLKLSIYRLLGRS